MTTATGSGALSALAELGVSVGPEHRTLVIADRDTLSRLVELARSTDPASSSAASAAVVGWWSQRADHPGTGAVLNVTVACSARWVLGVPPDDERQVSVWRTWLGIADTGPRGLLELAALVSAGQTLPGLETFTEDDQRSWESFATRLADPKTSWDWRMRDNRREAALGLATRCDAAELYESLRLGDPLVATRESFSGTVVSGVVTAVSARTRIEVTLDHLACRLRENAAVEGYPRFPARRARRQRARSVAAWSGGRHARDHRRAAGHHHHRRGRASGSCSHRAARHAATALGRPAPAAQRPARAAPPLRCAPLLALGRLPSRSAATGRAARRRRRRRRVAPASNG